MFQIQTCESEVNNLRSAEAELSLLTVTFIHQGTMKNGTIQSLGQMNIRYVKLNKIYTWGLKICSFLGGDS